MQEDRKGAEARDNMADIELVIKMPEEAYNATCNGRMLPPDVENVVNAIANGTPLPERPRWIPVSERLPDVGDTYIVTVEFCGNVVGVDAAIYPGKYIDMFDTLNDWVEGSPEGYHISAWMPMPEPHREVEE